MQESSKGRLHGKVATYFKKGQRKGLRVYITDHTLTADMRLSNWVTFAALKADGTLGQTSGDYDQKTNFRYVRGAELRIFREPQARVSV